MNMRSPYKAKTLSGAQKRVRQQDRLLESQRKLLEQYSRDRKLLAMLAAKEPQFHNPIHVLEAEGIRDRVLRSIKTYAGSL